MGNKLSLTAHPEWVLSLQTYIKPYWDKLLASPFVDGAAKGKLSVSQMQGWMTQIYPFIHTFPKFLAETLTKVEDDASREYFIDNIKVEKQHADHWLWMGMSFGVPKKEMLDLAEGKKVVLRDVQHLTDWIWSINMRGTLAEAVAATSFAIEGITHDISTKVVEGFKHYKGKPGVRINEKTYQWFKEHVHYDDMHPKQALEIVKSYVKTDNEKRKVMFAAKRSIQLLELALETSCRAYAPLVTPTVSLNGKSKRTKDRRNYLTDTGFPDRRFRERRSNPFLVVA